MSRKDLHIYDEAKLKELQQDPDLDGDGDVEGREISLLERKMKNQRKMAWIALLSMLLVTLILFTPLIPVDRVKAIGELIGLFYLGMAGIVGAFMGFTSWMSRR